MRSNSHEVSAKILSPQIGDLVGEQEAAAILGLTVRTLRNWRWRHEGPRFRKLGLRAVRYARSDLAAFIAGESVDDAPNSAPELEVLEEHHHEIPDAVDLTPGQVNLKRLREKRAVRRKVVTR